MSYIDPKVNIGKVFGKSERNKFLSLITSFKMSLEKISCWFKKKERKALKKTNTALSLLWNPNRCKTTEVWSVLWYLREADGPYTSKVA